MSDRCVFISWHLWETLWKVFGRLAREVCWKMWRRVLEDKTYQQPKNIVWCLHVKTIHFSWYKEYNPMHGKNVEEPSSYFWTWMKDSTRSRNLIPSVNLCVEFNLEAEKTQFLHLDLKHRKNDPYRILLFAQLLCWWPLFFESSTFEHVQQTSALRSSLDMLSGKNYSFKSPRPPEPTRTLDSAVNPRTNQKR